MERRDKVVSGQTYSLLLPPVRQAMPLCSRAVVLIGPLLGALGKPTTTDGVPDPALKSSGLEAFAGAVRGVDPVALDQLMMDAVGVSHLSLGAQPISDPINFERHFSAHRADTYPVCLWVLWEVVRDFLPGSGDFAHLLGPLRTAAGSPSPKGGK